jgi:hypothetical protein
LREYATGDSAVGTAADVRIQHAWLLSTRTAALELMKMMTIKPFKKEREALFNVAEDAKWIFAIVGVACLFSLCAVILAFVAFKSGGTV